MCTPHWKGATLGNIPVAQTETYPLRRNVQQSAADPGLGGRGPGCSYDVPPPVPPEQEIILSNEQKEILEHVKQGKNIFFTGAAGSVHSLLFAKGVS